ncbi:hypothetical protein Lal_00016631 [Lupinus albus]|nr:hypothetical protein Lal_00016631 [Lupinus albus]
MQFNLLSVQKEFTDIPEKEYDFKFFGDILSGNYRTYLLIDIIGVFHKLIFSQTEASFKKIIFSLRDFSGDVINCTLWESHAMKFMNYYNNQPIREPMIILLTHARVKEGQGKYSSTVSNSWCESKILIDEEIVNLDIYKQRYKLDIKVIHKNGSGKFVFWDRQYADIIGISTAHIRNQMLVEEEDDPKAYPLSLDFLLARTMALRVKVQPSYNQSFMIRLYEDPNLIKTILDTIGILEPISITADHDPYHIQVVNLAKRLSSDFDINLL